MAREASAPRRAPARGEPASTSEIRCDCGSLLARWTDGGLEIKCRRCKRQVIVRVEGRAPPHLR